MRDDKLSGGGSQLRPNLNIEEAKERLRLPELCHKLGIPAKIPERDGQTVPCIWPDRHANGDKTPSFNFYDDRRRYKCFACGAQGDGPDLISAKLGISHGDAIDRFIAMAGGNPPSDTHKGPTKGRALRLPKLSRGTRLDREALARLRRIDEAAIDLAVNLGLLRFGQCCGCNSWILRDESGLIAEARRLDGQTFSATGGIGARKAHTLAGSIKSWPLGIAPRHSSPHSFKKILVCEGGPDLLAAFHFCLRFGVFDALPVTILGRNTSRIHPEAGDRFRGRRVRIFPHADADGGGLLAAERWAAQIKEFGAVEVDYFDFDGLVRFDGSPVKDLNDCTIIDPNFETQLDNLLT